VFGYFLWTFWLTGAFLLILGLVNFVFEANRRPWMRVAAGFIALVIFSAAMASMQYEEHHTLCYRQHQWVC